MTFTELQLDTFSQPLSATEDSKCKNTIRMVADALKDIGFSDDGDIAPLYADTYAYTIQMRSASGRKVKLFIQGSYANNTNVRAQSDVDIAVIQEDVFTTEYREANSTFPQCDSDYGFQRVPSPAKSFKDEVQECLIKKFGRDVERKNKSIRIHGNSYRKDADSVPCRRYKDFRKDYNKDPANFVGGILITPDRGPRIINYPEQHIANGRAKNSSTHRHYKKLVRIIKTMRYLMEESGVTAYTQAAKNVNSFMLESLLWNIEDNWYLDNCGKYRKVFVFHLLIQLLDKRKEDIKSYKEANGIKPLCPDALAYEQLCVFIDQLSLFYDYV